MSDLNRCTDTGAEPMKDRYIHQVMEVAGDLSEYEHRMAVYYFCCGIPVFVCAMQIGRNRLEDEQAANSYSGVL